ncbi:MAG TPA: hypothetical protein VFO94_20170, partial [Gammaproteobacteria bacterium]|nr:hypothetical protein [Gammaproteobacteria bacterium]
MPRWMAMNDQQLADLFAEGTAPEPDVAFALRVEADIGRARLRLRLLELALRGAVMLLVAGAVFAAARTIEPLLGQLIGGSAEFMGVPVPVVLVVVIAGLALRGQRYFGAVVARAGKG